MNNESLTFTCTLPREGVVYGCKNCQKSDVCKWSEEFSAFAKLAEESIPGNLSDFVKVEATCKYYHQKPQGGIR